MKKLFRLTVAALVGLFLVGVLFTSLSSARAAELPPVLNSQAAGVPREHAATQATPLTLSVPDRSLDLGMSDTLDLLSYTIYDGDSVSLTFTATVAASPYFTLSITGNHFLNITSTSDTTGGTFPVSVIASDGVLSDTDQFTVTISGTSNPTLTLMLPPRIGVEPGGGVRVLDLWNFTNYHLADKSGLVYTVTQQSGTAVTSELVDSHFIRLTGESASTGFETIVDVEVSDGTLYDTVEIRAVTADTPVLDFYGDYYDVAPNPFYATAGESQYLTFDDEYRNAQPLHRFVRDGSWAYFRVINSDEFPGGLGASVVTDTINCSYTYCYFLEIEPELGTMGTYQVDVEVWNSAFMTGTDTLTVTVLQNLYLPIVIRGFPPAVKLLPVNNPDGDGYYKVEWELIGGGHTGFELQYDTDPNFTNPTSRYPGLSTIYSVKTLTTDTYYWRVRAYNSEKNFSWSNVQAVTVRSFAYLYVEPLCAYNLRIDVTGMGNSYAEEWDTSYCNSVVYWRSIPAGSYSTRMRWLTPSGFDYSFNQTLGNDEYIIRAGDLPEAWSEY